MKHPANSPSNKEDKKAKEDECLVCWKPDTDDIFKCLWYENRQHHQCTKISADQCHVLNNIVENIVFFCSSCLLKLPHALHNYDSQRFFDLKLEGVESQLSKVQALEDTCKKLQQSVEDLSSKITTVSSSNNNLQMCIDSTSESLNSAQTNSVVVPPASSTMSILDELADHDRRKKNIVVYNLPEPAPNDKGDSDAFAAMCSSVYSCS